MLPLLTKYVPSQLMGTKYYFENQPIFWSKTQNFSLHTFSSSAGFQSAYDSLSSSQPVHTYKEQWNFHQIWCTYFFVKSARKTDNERYRQAYILTESFWTFGVDEVEYFFYINPKKLLQKKVENESEMVKRYVLRLSSSQTVQGLYSGNNCWTELQE